MLLPLFCSAADLTLSGYVETGDRSQAEDLEEEESDREYRFQNYHVKFTHKPSGPLSYEVSSFIYDRDYRSQDSLDNISRIFKAGGSYYLKKLKNNSLKLSLKLKYKEKRYRDSPSKEYDQVMLVPKLTYTEKDSHAINLAAGVNNYDYTGTGTKDQLRFFSRLGAKKYLLKKKLLLASSYKFEATTHRNAGRQKNKNDLMLGFEYLFKNQLIHKIAVRAELGQRDTKDDDARDEDFDYKHRRFHLRTESRLTKKIQTGLKFQYFKKDYLTADLDHSGFYVLGRWKYIVISDADKTFYFNSYSERKDVHYSVKQAGDYIKHSLRIKATYNKKKNWKTSASLQGSFYDYEDKNRNRNRYYARYLFEKMLFKRVLRLTLNLKYKYTDNRQAADTEEQAARLAFKYSF